MSKVSVDDFWPEFGKDVALPEVECDYTGSLAQRVLNYYGIPCNDSTGGSLPNLDIKQMDAMQIIKLSLLEASANDDAIYEPVMSADGVVEFKAIGESSSSLNDVYYKIQSSSYTEKCSGVMVSGRTPLAARRPINWYPIWRDSPQAIYNVGLMYNTECVKKGFNQYCTIIYNDPHLDSSFEDGIDNLYEINAEENPFDSIVGYAYYITWDKDLELDKNVSITSDSSARILMPLDLELKGLGVLQERPIVDSNLTSNLKCYANELEVKYGDGIPLDLPAIFRYESVRGTTVDKFEGVEAVYVVGLKIDLLYGHPPSKAEAINKNPAKGSAQIFVRINDTNDTLFTLSRGEHYEVAYEEGSLRPSIVFVDNSLASDPIGMPPNGKAHFYVDETCLYSHTDEGVTRLEEDGYILPTGRNNGILIKEIYACVSLNTPSINIYHPQGWDNRARTIAESLEYLVSPLVVINEPEPIAFNGTLIDRVAAKMDHDPTTAQDFEDSDYERALDEMSEGSGLVLSLSFLDADQVERLSGTLYNYLNSGDGIDATYICGPDADPQLGDLGPDGTSIINSINYSYQDSNSYTISVQTGPKTLGDFAQVGSGGPNFKATEEISCKGTIIQDAGNNVHFKVSIDGIGDRIAINMCPAILRAGDKVTVAIHNNPVEV